VDWSGPSGFYGWSVHDEKIPSQFLRTRMNWMKDDERSVPKIELDQCWLLTYPSEKTWSSSVGMMTFPIKNEK
jgi:hypothetical protein